MVLLTSMIRLIPSDQMGIVEKRFGGGGEGRKPDTLAFVLRPSSLVYRQNARME